MKIKISVCTDDGWQTVHGDADAAAPSECLALPKDKSRSEFWASRLNQPVPKGRMTIWEILE